MNFSQEDVLKFLAIGGLIAFILLLISFQFVFAIIVLIIAIIAWYLLKKGDQGNA